MSLSSKALPFFLRPSVCSARKTGLLIGAPSNEKHLDVFQRYPWNSEGCATECSPAVGMTSDLVSLVPKFTERPITESSSSKVLQNHATALLFASNCAVVQIEDNKIYLSRSLSQCAQLDFFNSPLQGQRPQRISLLHAPSGWYAMLAQVKSGSAIVREVSPRCQAREEFPHRFQDRLPVVDIECVLHVVLHQHMIGILCVSLEPLSRYMGYCLRTARSADSYLHWLQATLRVFHHGAGQALSDESPQAFAHSDGTKTARRLWNRHK